MDANEYQRVASKTMQFEKGDENARAISLLGLSGEIGELSTEYKKDIRDGDKYKIFREKIIEELGDILWYISTLATLENIELNDILDKNIEKTQERWHDLPELSGFPDDGYPEDERFPRKFTAVFTEKKDKDNRKSVKVTIEGDKLGATLRDNAYEDDSYRFHDIFHIAYVATLGWSPVVRKQWLKKRKSCAITDEVEDGGRASAIDEAISILVFEHARNHKFYDEVGGVIDYKLLDSIKLLTRNLNDVKNCTSKQWEHAILEGFKIWNKLKATGGGRVHCNMHERKMTFEPLSQNDLKNA